MDRIVIYDVSGWICRNGGEWQRMHMFSFFEILPGRNIRLINAIQTDSITIMTFARTTRVFDVLKYFKCTMPVSLTDEEIICDQKFLLINHSLGFLARETSFSTPRIKKEKKMLTCGRWQRQMFLKINPNRSNFGLSLRGAENRILIFEKGKGS